MSLQDINSPKRLTIRVGRQTIFLRVNHGLVETSSHASFEWTVGKEVKHVKDWISVRKMRWSVMSWKNRKGEGHRPETA